MPVLTVIEGGLASAQGLGNYGGQRYGISPGGAMDRLALAEANALAGQPAGAVAIEIGPLPLRLKVAGGCIRLATSGAERDLLVNDRPVGIGATFVVQDGDIFTVRGARDGRFTYLSAQGGMLGFRSPLANRSQPGRSWILDPGDEIDAASATVGQAEVRLRTHSRSVVPIRVVLGPNLDQFTPAAVNGFLATRWAVSNAANRMAYLLEGGRVEPRSRPNRISDGTVTGNIQIAGSGQPIVILCDRGTVGGYPKVATIISADLGRFAQTPVGGQINFEAVSILEAQTVAREFAHKLANIKTQIRSVDAEVSLNALLESNIAGDVFDAAQWMAEERRNPGQGASL